MTTPAIRRRRLFLGTLLLPAALVLGGVRPRPKTWAVPLKVQGFHNLHRVNGDLYRCAQPSSAAFAELAARPVLQNGDRPVKTVLSLRAFNDDEPRAPADAPFQLENIRFNTWHPEDEDVVKFLRLVASPDRLPLLVHCQHGSDRTGTMVAIYRIAVQGWSKESALDEMVNGGYGFHPLWKNLRRYIRNLDVAAVKAKAAADGPWR
ncbi:MAG TPA: tyrosine-protein phosphatase [Elusimicrobiota bacterium]|nr:tyrosine-protein phosphatase [Elusimicrobiota bacterium]HMX42567.1 tyrosine-protein phosphatase [Elusimicrobiota bacterium]HMX94115.1 tyrosine-protein phosphatase [Elusimicrobiota bacterium]HND63985.1 tyrosine-protein phosphatase [Elusimicrobiota bacterium]